MARKISPAALEEVRAALVEHDSEVDSCTTLRGSTKTEYRKRAEVFVDWLAGESKICRRPPCSECLSKL